MNESQKSGTKLRKAPGQGGGKISSSFPLSGENAKKKGIKTAMKFKKEIKGRLEEGEYAPSRKKGLQ